MVVIKVNYTTDAPIIKVNYDDAPIYISTTVDATYIKVDYGSGGDSTAVWGLITGTLSDQTDLQNALDDKVPYTGATGNVDLGEYELKAGQLTLDTSPTGTASVGTTRWNDTIGSSETTLKGGSVILKNGVDLVARVVNKVTPNTTLTKAAYQAVRISGAQGQRLAVAFAQANNDNNSADTIGLVTETIATNQEGFIMTVGNLEDINTTGSLQGETWADGDVLYLSPTVAGAITNIKPVAPQHLVVIGYVEYAHANHGKIYVKVMNGWELGELHDVDTTGATAGQVLKYNGTIWTPSSDLDTGITSLNGLTALTQTFATGTSGTDFNISSATSTHTFNLPTASATNRGLVSSSDWSTFNAKIGGTLATGQVAFGSAANTIAGSNNLFWDNTNGRLGIGTNAPAYRLHNVGTSAFDNGASADAINILNDGFLKWTSVRFRGFATSFIFQDNSFNTKVSLSMSGSVSTFNTGGNYVFGGTTDSGQRLQVQGDAFIKGSGNTSATSALLIQNSDGTNMFRFRSDNNLIIGSANSSIRTGDSLISGATSGSILYFSPPTTWDNTGKAGIGIAVIARAWTASTAVNSQVFLIGEDGTGFAPTSGSLTRTYFQINATINQTGGANGITRGLYVNPTLTAAADWRSIEWSNNSGWGLYGAGTSNNFLAGSLGIGTNNILGYNLRISKTLTGSYFTALRSDGVIQSDLTGTVRYFESVPSSANANFNISTIYQYIADQGTFNNVTAGGTVTNQYGFFANSTLIGATNNFGFYGNIPSGTNRWNIYMNGTANNYMAGSLGIGNTSLTGITLRLSKALTGAVTSYGVYNECQILSDVTNQVSYFQSQANTQAAAFTLSNLYHYLANQSSIGAGSSVTNQYGFFANSNIIGATNNYGFYSNIASGTGRWNFYANGTADNYMAGALGIGTTSLTGYSLRVNKSLTGATTAYGIQQTGTVQSDVTSVAIGIINNLYTANATFSIAGYYHYFASQTYMGTGNTITSQYGYFVENSLTGATNNFGFYGNIPSGTGRWNFFANGTAANYLNGNTIIGGSAVDGGFKLEVNGTSRITTSLMVGTNALSSGVKLETDGVFRAWTRLDIGQFGTVNINTTSFTKTASGSDYFEFTNGGTYNPTAGTYYFLQLRNTVNPTSGTAVVNGLNLNFTINQTGGANGITRGLYINPTLTAAADWRAIEAVSASNANHTLLKLRNATVDVFTVKADSKIGFYNATPVAQPTTAIAEAAFVENSGGTAVNVDSTFAGYTLQQIAQALKDLGILA